MLTLFKLFGSFGEMFDKAIYKLCVCACVRACVCARACVCVCVHMSGNELLHISSVHLLVNILLIIKLFLCQRMIHPLIVTIFTGRRPDGFNATVKLRCGPYNPTRSALGRPEAVSTGQGLTRPAILLPSTPTQTAKQDAWNRKHTNTGET